MSVDLWGVCVKVSSGTKFLHSCGTGCKTIFGKVVARK